MSADPNTFAAETEYAWELATLYPPQGHWSEEDYLSLTDSSRRGIEYVDGRLEFLPMPTEIHQELIQFLFFALHSFVSNHDLGKIHFSGIRMRILDGRIREPDIVFLLKEGFHKRHNRVWEGADLAVEVVSDDAKDRKRDYEEKLVEYAAGGISEYWIVDPQRRLVIVHRLAGDSYQVHGEFKESEEATSVLLDGFSLDVSALFAAADEVPE